MLQQCVCILALLLSSFSRCVNIAYVWPLNVFRYIIGPNRLPGALPLPFRVLPLSVHADPSRHGQVTPAANQTTPFKYYISLINPVKQKHKFSFGTIEKINSPCVDIAVTYLYGAPQRSVVLVCGTTPLRSLGCRPPPVLKFYMSFLLIAIILYNQSYLMQLQPVILWPVHSPRARLLYQLFQLC